MKWQQVIQFDFFNHLNPCQHERLPCRVGCNRCRHLIDQSSSELSRRDVARSEILI